MSVSSGMFPNAGSAVAVVKKKRVLLVDTSRAKRDLRSETMRKLGMEVDCAADLSEARCWWRAGLYDLVLLNVPGADGAVEKFCQDVNTATLPQQIMFLVGRPDFLSATPPSDGSVADSDDGVAQPPTNGTASSTGPDGERQRWGILEACRRISAVRSVGDARARAMRNQPEPRRDFETSRPGRILDPETIKLIHEELQ
jgi:hypothetical protein